MVFDALIKYIICAFVTVLAYELHHLEIDFFSFIIIKTLKELHRMWVTLSSVNVG